MRFAILFMALGLHSACVTQSACQIEARPILGWVEQVSLPALGINSTLAKIDTGAKTSSLHAEGVKEIEKEGKKILQFSVYADNSKSKNFTVTAPLKEYRLVKNSGGAETLRPVIETTMQIGDKTWTIDLNLIEREKMTYQMLLGRQAIRNEFLIDAKKKFAYSKPIHSEVSNAEE